MVLQEQAITNQDTDEEERKRLFVTQNTLRH